MNTARLVGLALLLGPVAATATGAEDAFSRLEKARYVTLSRVLDCVEMPAPRLVSCTIAPERILLGTLAQPVPAVVQELVFQTDRPQLRRGLHAILLLEPMPRQSRLDGAIGTGPFLRLAGGAAAVLPATTLPTVEFYLKASSQTSPDRRKAAQLGVFVGAVTEPHLGESAIGKLRDLEELSGLLKEDQVARLATAMSEGGLPSARRRQLIELVALRKLIALVPVLRKLTEDRELGPYARSALAALDQKISPDDVRKDLVAASPEVRAAALRSTRILPVEERLDLLQRAAQSDDDFSVQLQAVELLRSSGQAAVPALGAVLDDGEQRIAHHAAQALAAIGGDAALAALERQFKGGKYPAQVAAVFALRSNASPQALAILGRVRDKPPDPRLEKVLEAASGVERGHHH